MDLSSIVFTDIVNFLAPGMKIRPIYGVITAINQAKIEKVPQARISAIKQKLRRFHKRAFQRRTALSNEEHRMLRREIYSSRSIYVGNFTLPTQRSFGAAPTECF